MLKRLQQLGLIERRRDDVDERRVLINLTERGSALHERAREVPRRMQAELQLDPERHVALRDELRRLLQTLDQAAGRPKE